MQALPIVPIDPPAAGPPASASAKTGQEGQFASRLKTATEQQTAAARPNEPRKKPSASHGDEQSPATGDIADAQGQGDTATPEASLNGSAGAALQQPPAEPKVAIAAVEAGLNGNLASVQSSESAVARMLDALTAPGTAAMNKNDSATLPIQQGKEEQPSVFSIHSSSDPQQASTAATIAAPAMGSGNKTSTPLSGSAPTQPQATVSFTAEAQSSGTPIANQTAGQTTAASALSASSSPTDPLIVQNKYGQIITIYQGNGVEEEAAVSPDGAGKTAAATTDGQRLDVNGNYIRSHLPNERPDNASDEGSSQQQDSPAQSRQQETVATSDPAKNGQPTFEQTVLPKTPPTFGQEASPLLFAHQQGSSQQTGSSAPVSSQSFQLPSGLTVPEGTVVDQMITHFSTNKRLETGTVNLRLYPQELGELRMEIKVEQDNIKAHIVAQNPQAQEMIDRHLPRLREALEQQGLHLQQVEVTIAAHDNTGNERFQESGAWQQPSPAAHRTASDQPAFALETDDIAGEEHTGATTLSVLA